MKNTLNEIQTMVSDRAEVLVKERPALISSVDAQIKSIKNEPTIFEKVKKTIYGFEAEINEQVDRMPEINELEKSKETISKISNNAKKFTQNQIGLVNSLSKIGIVPIAVLPTQLWDSLCTKFKIFRFEHIDKNGLTVAKFDSYFMRSYRGSDFELSASAITSHIFPDYVDYPSGMREFHSVDYRKITIKFPQAPSDFLEVLSKVSRNGLKPLIAAEQSAIVLDPKEINRIYWDIKEEKEKKKRENADPILYINNLEITAVLSQFGDFPREKELIKWVKKEGLQLAFN